MVAESRCDRPQRPVANVSARELVQQVLQPLPVTSLAPVDARRCVAIRFDPASDTKMAHRALPPQPRSETEDLQRQPHAPSLGLGADQPSGIAIASRKFAASSTHRASSSGVLQKS